ncbi:MAG TPA: hypothetical protein VNG29_03065 [Candidatus Paceibacterota bacterium]|nr:hypothetical protein [Candidatus Paceibacterota bacterium]
MKGRHRGPTLLPETGGENACYLGGIIAVFAGFFFMFTAMMFIQGTVVGAPVFPQAHPFVWFLIGIVLLAIGAEIVLWTDARQWRRTKAARAAQTGTTKAT